MPHNPADYVYSTTVLRDFTAADWILYQQETDAIEHECIEDDMANGMTRAESRAEFARMDADIEEDFAHMDEELANKDYLA